MTNQELSQNDSPKSPNSWGELINPILEEQFVKDIFDRIAEESLKYNILPGSENVFNAFKFTPYDKLSIVILGQDPYPNKQDAHGLAFSSKAQAIPKSLGVIFDEIKRSLYNIYSPQDQSAMFSSGDLTSWADQGVLLLNTTLTVREGQSESHATIGWAEFTKRVMQELNNYGKPVVFMFWGKKAQEYAGYITDEKHLKLLSCHPAAQLYSQGKTMFVGNGHFYNAVKFLHKARPELITDKGLDLAKFIDYKKIVERIFEKMFILGAPNENFKSGGDDNRSHTMEEIQKILIDKGQWWDIPCVIDWKTNK